MAVYIAPTVSVTVIAFYDYTIAQFVEKRFSSTQHVHICERYGAPRLTAELRAQGRRAKASRR